MEPQSDRPDDQNRWYGDDPGWDPRGTDTHADRAGYRVPEPRGGEPPQPHYPPGPAESRWGELRYQEPRYDASPGEPDQRGPASEGSFPGFQPLHVPPEPSRAVPGPAPGGNEPGRPPAAAAPYPEPVADPAAVDRRQSLDVPTGPVPPVPPAQSRPGGPGTLAQPPRYHAEPINRAALRRPAGPAAPVGDGVYRTRRPAVALVLAALVAVLEIPALRLLIEGAFGDVASASAIVAGMLLGAGLPPMAIGTYALVTGAARVPDQPPGHAWLRAPLAYLIIGLVLFLAAGLAAA